MIRALSLDAVGTIIAPHPSVGAVYALVARRYDIEVEDTVLNTAFPQAFSATLAEWPVPYGSDEVDARRFWSAVIRRTFPIAVSEFVCSAIYDAFQQPSAWRILPGVRATLALATARGLPVAVVSNFDCRLAPLLDALKLGPFAAVITSAGVGRAKPDPTPLLAAAKVLGLAPRSILHIGDNVREDGGMCATSGAHFLAVESNQGIDAGRVHALLEGSHSSC